MVVTWSCYTTSSTSEGEPYENVLCWYGRASRNHCASSIEWSRQKVMESTIETGAERVRLPQAAPPRVMNSAQANIHLQNRER